jgi:hypothetical protein
LGAKLAIGIDKRHVPLKDSILISTTTSLMRNGYRSSGDVNNSGDYDFITIPGDIRLSVEDFSKTHLNGYPNHFGDVSLVVSHIGPYYHDTQPKAIKGWTLLPNVRRWLEGGHRESAFPVEMTRYRFSKVADWQEAHVWPYEMKVYEKIETFSVFEAVRKDQPNETDVSGFLPIMGTIRYTVSPREGKTEADAVTRFKSLRSHGFRGFTPVTWNDRPDWIEQVLNYYLGIGDKVTFEVLKVSIYMGLVRLGVDRKKVLSGAKNKNKYYIAINDNPDLAATLVRLLNHRFNEEKLKKQQALTRAQEEAAKESTIKEILERLNLDPKQAGRA